MSTKMTLEEDYEAWENGNTVEYAGFVVKPKLDMGGWPDKHGWVVTDDIGCNAMPGATWAKTQEQAIHLIDVFLAVEQDGQRFWHLLRAIRHSKGIS